MTGRYYSVDYNEEYYIFDSEVISKDKVEMEAEYDYDVFGNSMSSTEIVEVMNDSDELNKYSTAGDDTITTILELAETVLSYNNNIPNLEFIFDCFKAIKECDILKMDELKKEIRYDAE